MPLPPVSRRKAIPLPLLILLFLLTISAFINYVDRGNLSIAAPMLKDELGISGSQLGVLLSAFFWTYACMQPVAGWLVDRVNVNLVLAGGFFLWSAATATTGIAHSFAVLFILRLLLGLGESVTFPSYCKIIALNFAEDQRGFANSVVSAGYVLGPGFGMLFGGLLMEKYGWRPFFLTLGLASLVWLLPWFFVSRRPAVRPIAAAAGRNRVPNLGEFLRLRSAWGTSIGLFCGNYVNYFLITWLPFFLIRERHFAMHEMAQIGGAAYLSGAASAVLTGWLSDRWIRSGATPTLVRKTIVGGGLALCGIFTGLAVVASQRYCVAALIVGVVFWGVTSSNLWAITQTLAGPQAAGRWTGFQNMIGNFAGMAAPALTGVVLDFTGEFYWAFVVLVLVALSGSACWVFMIGRVEQVKWHEVMPAPATGMGNA
jgi:MFS transporter, ACS family, D-galactonate transporter